MNQRRTQDEQSPTRLWDVPVLPLRAGRHLTAWIVWHTAKVSLLSDHSAPQPPAQESGAHGGRAA
ncbi:MAG TPA: hypothetical protein VFB51_00760 [Solirubrobacterales bacterium]|nr:hypothetical protein [Solirubrobacterales bacterium]